MPHGEAWEAVPQREADLVPLRVAVHHARTPAEAASAQAALDAELDRRSRVDTSVRLAVSTLLRNNMVRAVFQVRLGRPCALRVHDV